MATTSLPPESRITQSVWLDVNTQMDLNGKPDLLPDVQAINNSLFNLFRCNVGGRGPIFQPEYGTNLMQLIHEPMDNITANKIRIFLIQAIQRWEPRIIIDMLRTNVQPNTMTNSFQVQVYYSIVGINQPGNASLTFSRA
jgi:phage baseplate assembly protein W